MPARQSCRAAILLALCSLFLPGAKAAAAVYKVATLGGLMQQPTSHYYHAVYGAQVDVGTESEAFLGRLGYIERPEFSSEGFADKEYGGFAQIGTKLTKQKTHGAFAFVGAGRMQGYVRAEKGHATSAPARRRSFTMGGVTASVEYAATLKGFDVGVGHQSFVGFADNTQTDAYVAWPYNFFNLSLGYKW